jgi:hypothetical protein
MSVAETLAPVAMVRRADVVGWYRGILSLPGVRSSLRGALAASSRFSWRVVEDLIGGSFVT